MQSSILEEPICPSDRTRRAWQRFVSNGLLQEERREQLLALNILGVKDTMAKIPVPDPTSQVQCLHTEVLSRSNLLCHWLTCRNCQLRISYVPMPQEPQQAESQRRLRLAGRRWLGCASTSVMAAAQDINKEIKEQPQAVSMIKVSSALHDTAQHLHMHSVQIRRLREAIAPEADPTEESDFTSDDEDPNGEPIQWSRTPEQLAAEAAYYEKRRVDW